MNNKPSRLEIIYCSTFVNRGKEFTNSDKTSRLWERGRGEVIGSEMVNLGFLDFIKYLMIFGTLS